MKTAGGGPFAAPLKALRKAAEFTQEELATIAGLSVHAISALVASARALLSDSWLRDAA
jgi:transcriptional regulator with XRE-family HTH domain